MYKHDSHTPVADLKHWGRDEMVDIFQTTFPNTFSWKIIWISINISLKFVPRGPIHNVPALIPIIGSDQAPSHYLIQWWLVYWRICVTRPQWVKVSIGWFCVMLDKFYLDLKICPIQICNWTKSALAQIMDCLFVLYRDKLWYQIILGVSILSKNIFVNFIIISPSLSIALFHLVSTWLHT